MIKEKYEKIPEFIKERYEQELITSQPIKALEHIVFVWKKFWASDVHIVWVPYSDDSEDSLVLIKYRIDWKLDNYIYNLSEKIRNDPKSYIIMGKYAEFIRAVKNSFELWDYNETEKPQDVAYKFEHFEKDKKVWETKVRANFMPMWIDIKWDVWVHQSFVMRIIDDSVDSLPKYSKLWIMPSDILKLNEFLKSEKWALINSWPTGSWKSVSMQVLMSQIASEDKKIHTLEDPIEYRNPLLIQTQIKPSVNFTWDMWIRWLMRQDPDIIMVWEVRDYESAELFIEASLTWHMGFTTTHAKTWCGAFYRLKLMWVKSYLIVGGVSISMSQRLSQKLCSECRKHITDDLIKEKLNNIWGNTFWSFDFSTLTYKDILFMIWDEDKRENQSRFENLYKQFNALKNKILEASEEEKISIKQKIIEYNNQLQEWLRDYFVNNFYDRNIAKQWDKICSKCMWNWVKWRVWVFEFIKTTKDIEQLILNDTPLKHMETFVRENNILTLDRYWVIRAMRWEIDMQELLKLL